MACQLALEGFHFSPLDGRFFCHRDHIRVIGRQVVGIFGHLCREVHVGASEVSHCCPIIFCLLGEVGKCLFYPDQVVGSIDALARCLLLFS